MKPFDFITFGNATRDVFMRSRQFPVDESILSFKIGAKVEIDDVIFETGGGATNSAVCFSRLGYRTAFVGRLGAHDIRGKEILARLQKEGVETSLIQHDRILDTAYSVILLPSSGDRTVLVYRGASKKIKANDVPWGRLMTKWFYVTSLAGNMSLLKKIILTAKAKKIKIALNPGTEELDFGRRALLPLLKLVDVLILNKQEAATLSGLPTKSNDSIFKDLCIALPGIVVITDGKKGATVCDNEKRFRTVPRQIKVVDPTGAGDAFGAGFVAAYQKSFDLSYSLKFATMNAESVIGTVGAKEGLLNRLPNYLNIIVRAEPFPN